MVLLSTRLQTVALERHRGGPDFPHNQEGTGGKTVKDRYYKRYRVGVHDQGRVDDACAHLAQALAEQVRL